MNFITSKRFDSNRSTGKNDINNNRTTNKIRRTLAVIYST